MFVSTDHDASSSLHASCATVVGEFQMCLSLSFCLVMVQFQVFKISIIIQLWHPWHPHHLRCGQNAEDMSCVRTLQILDEWQMNIWVQAESGHPLARGDCSYFLFYAKWPKAATGRSNTDSKLPKTDKEGPKKIPNFQNQTPDDLKQTLNNIKWSRNYPKLPKQIWNGLKETKTTCSPSARGSWRTTALSVPRGPFSNNLSHQPLEEVFVSELQSSPAEPTWLLLLEALGVRRV